MNENLKDLESFGAKLNSDNSADIEEEISEQINAMDTSGGRHTKRSLTKEN